MKPMSAFGSGERAWRQIPRLLPVLALGFVFSAAVADETGVKSTFVDLQSKANHKLADDLHGTDGNNLANVPRGEQTLAGTRFRIGEKMIHLRGEHVKNLPEKVEGIAVDATFDRLQILHSCGYGEGSDPRMEDGTEIGSYTIIYEDKSKERVRILYGEDLRDWWDWPDRTELKRAKVAWTGTNAAAEQGQRHIRLFSVTWENPHPEKKVVAIDFESTSSECDPFLVALTLERKL